MKIEGVQIGSRIIHITNPQAVGGVPYSVQFPDRGFLPDTRGEVRCLQSLVEQLRNREAISSVLETSSRVGITVSVWLDDLGVDQVFLNDPDNHQSFQLTSNFPEAVVFSEDICVWTWPKVDLVYADMNTFTLKKLDSWRFIFDKALEEAKARWLIFVDSCCYGFKFGKRASYLAYGPTEECYWNALRDALHDDFGWAIQFGSRYDRAALLAANRGDISSEMVWLSPGDKHVGFVYEVNEQRERFF